MADVVVSDLPLITQATLDDVFIINDGNDTTSSITWANMLASIRQLQGQVLFDNGTESSPSISFVNDINTGIYNPNLDEVSIVTNGVSRILVDEFGFVGIGNDTPSNLNAGANNLVIGDTDGLDNGLTIVSGTDSAGIINFADGIGLAASEGQILYDHSDNHMEFQTDGRESMRITTDNDVLIGRSFGQNGSRLLVTGGSVNVDKGDTGIAAYGFIDDPGTGVYSLAQYELGLTTQAVPRIVIDADGNVAIGNIDPQSHIHIQDEDPIITITDDSDPNSLINSTVDFSNGKLLIDLDNNLGGNDTQFKLSLDTVGRLHFKPNRSGMILDEDIYFSTTDGGVAQSKGDIVVTDESFKVRVDNNNLYSGSEYELYIDGTSQLKVTQTGDLQITGNGNIIFDRDTDTFFGHPAENQLAVTTTGVERARWNASGNYLIGTTVAVPVGGTDTAVQVHGVGDKGDTSQVRYSNDIKGAKIRLAKSRGTTVGTNTIVVANDTVGEITFHPADGNDFAGTTAAIKAQVDGTPGLDDIPGRLTFSTASSTANSVTERMRINSSGDVGIGTNDPNSRLTIVNEVSGTKSIAVKQSSAETFSVDNAGFVIASGYDIDTLPLLP